MSQICHINAIFCMVAVISLQMYDIFTAAVWNTVKESLCNIKQSKNNLHCYKYYLDVLILSFELLWQTLSYNTAVKPENQGEHTCPLCWDWFDTKTGLSNHVRGHLKRIGRSASSISKSPLCIINELLQDKKEHQTILQVLSKGQFPSRPSVSEKVISSGRLVLMHTIPVKIQYEIKSPHPIGDRFVPKQEAHTFSERNKLQAEAQRGIKASSSTLVELLKTRRESMELTARNNQEAYAVRKICAMTKDYKEETQMTSVESNRTHGMESYALSVIALLWLNRFCML